MKQYRLVTKAGLLASSAVAAFTFSAPAFAQEAQPVEEAAMKIRLPALLLAKQRRRKLLRATKSSLPEP